MRAHSIYRDYTADSGLAFCAVPFTAVFSVLAGVYGGLRRLSATARACPERSPKHETKPARPRRVRRCNRSRLIRSISSSNQLSSFRVPDWGGRRAGRETTTPGQGERRVWFSHSGCDANDCALRVLAATDRPRFISFMGSYHGNLSGSMGISGHTAITHTLPRLAVLLLSYPIPTTRASAPRP